MPQFLSPSRPHATLHSPRQALSPQPRDSPLPPSHSVERRKLPRVDPTTLSPKQVAEAIHAYAPPETSPMLEKLALENLIDGRTLVNCSEDLLSSITGDDRLTHDFLDVSQRLQKRAPMVRTPGPSRSRPLRVIVQELEKFSAPNTTVEAGMLSPPESEPFSSPGLQEEFAPPEWDFTPTEPEGMGSGDESLIGFSAEEETAQESLLFPADVSLLSALNIPGGLPTLQADPAEEDHPDLLQLVDTNLAGSGGHPALQGDLLSRQDTSFDAEATSLLHTAEDVADVTTAEMAIQTDLDDTDAENDIDGAEVVEDNADPDADVPLGPGEPQYLDEASQTEDVESDDSEETEGISPPIPVEVVNRSPTVKIIVKLDLDGLHSSTSGERSGAPSAQISATVTRDGENLEPPIDAATHTPSISVRGVIRVNGADIESSSDLGLPAPRGEEATSLEEEVPSTDAENPTAEQENTVIEPDVLAEEATRASGDGETVAPSSSAVPSTATPPPTTVLEVPVVSTPPAPQAASPLATRATEDSAQEQPANEPDHSLSHGTGEPDNADGGPSTATARTASAAGPQTVTKVPKPSTTTKAEQPAAKSTSGAGSGAKKTTEATSTQASSVSEAKPESSGARQEQTAPAGQALIDTDEHDGVMVQRPTGGDGSGPSIENVATSAEHEEPTRQEDNDKIDEESGAVHVSAADEDFELIDLSHDDEQAKPFRGEPKEKVAGQAPSQPTQAIVTNSEKPKKPKGTQGEKDRSASSGGAKDGSPSRGRPPFGRSQSVTGTQSTAKTDASPVALRRTESAFSSPKPGGQRQNGSDTPKTAAWITLGMKKKKWRRLQQ